MIRDPEEHTVFDDAGRGALGPGGRPDDARGGARGDLVADAPRAARPHVLEVPLARDARADPRRLHADRARGRAHRPPVRAAALPRAGVLDGRRRAGSCAGGSATASSSPPRATRATASSRSTSPAAPRTTPGRARLHVEVEIASFYPAIAFRIARWVYANTQSRIHVLVTHGFLRSLARLELEESAVGRFADAGDGAEPDRAGQRRRHAVAGGRRARRRSRARSRCSCGAAAQPPA